MKHHAGRWLLAGFGITLAGVAVGIAAAATRRLPSAVTEDVEAAAVPQPQPVP